MKIFKTLIDKFYKKEQIKNEFIATAELSKPDKLINLKSLWYNGTETEWKNALNGYYYMLKVEQREIEEYIENIDVEEIKNLNETDFYNFLYEKYFVWKYTAKNRLATTR